MSYREELFRVASGRNSRSDISDCAEKTTIFGVPILLSFGVIAAGAIAGIIPPEAAQMATTAGGIGAVVGMPLMSPLTVPLGEKLGDKWNKAIDLRNAAKRRKACYDSLQVVSLQGLKAKYNMQYEHAYGDITDSEEDGIVGFCITPTGKGSSKKASFCVSEKTFNQCFQVTEIKDKFDVEAMDTGIDENMEIRGEVHYNPELGDSLGVDVDLDKNRVVDLKDSIIEINKKYGISGTCELMRDTKVFVGDNTFVDDGSEYAMFLESPNTNKPDLNNPIILYDKDELMSLIGSMKA